MFLKKLFVDYQRSNLSVPLFYSLFGGACNLGCLKIIDDTWKKTILPPIDLMILLAHWRAETKHESYPVVFSKY